MILKKQGMERIRSSAITIISQPKKLYQCSGTESQGDASDDFS